MTLFDVNGGDAASDIVMSQRCKGEAFRKFLFLPLWYSSSELGQPGVRLTATV